MFNSVLVEYIITGHGMTPFIAVTKLGDDAGIPADIGTNVFLFFMACAAAQYFETKSFPMTSTIRMSILLAFFAIEFYYCVLSLRGKAP